MLWGFFGPLLLGIAAFFFLIKGLLVVVSGLFSWLGISIEYVLGSADFALEVALVDWIPQPFVAVFMAMVAFSILCCIFGRIRG